MPGFKVTVAYHKYRVFQVEAESWEQAKQVAETTEPDELQELPDPVDQGNEIYDAVAFVESLDGQDVFYERD